VLDNRSELEQVLSDRDVLGAVFARHAYGMRRWVDLFSERISQIDDPYVTELVAEIVAVNARHAVLFRERAIAHGIDPGAYVCPPEGEQIYQYLAPLEGDDTLAYALGSLEHFRDLLAVYSEAAVDPDDAVVLSIVRADNDAALARLREFARGTDGPAAAAAAAAAHELYRLRELAETPLYASRV